MNASTHLTAIVPARNEEASIAACIASACRATGIVEIIAINDQSSDRTAEILRDLAKSNFRTSA